MKLLIADDDGTNLAAYKALFKHQGLEVLTTPNGEEALRMIEEDSSIDALLTDFDMPGMSGLQLLYEVRKCRPKVRTFLGSGSLSENTSSHAKDFGAEATFQKPYDVEHICSILKK